MNAVIWSHSDTITSVRSGSDDRLHSLYQFIPKDFRFGFCEGQSNHFFINLTLHKGAPWCWNIKDPVYSDILHHRVLIQWKHCFLAVAVDLLTSDQCYWSSYTHCRIKWKGFSEISVSLTSILKAYILLNKMGLDGFQSMSINMR